MRLEQLEFIAAVVEHGSLRRASEELHLSQPALSEAVGKLERELGVTLLDRRRSGSRISHEGRELLGAMTEVLDAAERLRAAAGERAGATRVIRVGTVDAGTCSVLVPAVREFRVDRPQTGVEVADLQQAPIHRGLVEGSLHLGLVNLLPGDDTPPELDATVLVHGRPVVVLPAAHPLARADEVRVEQLRAEPFVSMRAGYLMHRFAHRLFEGRPPRTTYATDGATTGKVMVAEGLGLTVLPDYSVAQDPLERAGVIVHRPIAGDRTTVSLVLLAHREAQVPAAVTALARILVGRGRTYRETATSTLSG